MTRVRVFQIADELGNDDDRQDLPAGANEQGSWKDYDVPAGYDDDDETALDWFHCSVPIGNLDDFEFEIIGP